MAASQFIHPKVRLNSLRDFALVAVAFLLLANSQAHAQGKEGPDRLDGAWKMTTLELDGMPIDLGERQPRWLIKGNRVYYGGEEIIRLNLDPAANPKIVDLSFLDQKKVYEGIYALEKDTLRICLNKQADGVKERPESFSTKGTTNRRLLVFTRVSGAEADPKKGLTGFIGVALAFDRKENQLKVSASLPGSPAQKAGLKKDDIVLKIGGADVTGLLPAVESIRQARPGSDVTMRILRGGKGINVTIRVGIFPFAFLARLD